MYLMTSFYNECCYVKQFNVNNNIKKPRKKWFTLQLKQFRDYVILLYDRFKLSRGTINETNNKNSYKLAKKQYKTMIKQEKMLANEMFISGFTNKCKAAWRVITSEINYSSKPDVRHIKSSVFNEYFINSAVFYQ